MMTANHYPLPNRTYQQYRREDKVYKLVGDEYDAERDDDETYGNKWTIDLECTFDVLIVESK